MIGDLVERVPGSALVALGAAALSLWFGLTETASVVSLAVGAIVAPLFARDAAAVLGISVAVPRYSGEQRRVVSGEERKLAVLRSLAALLLAATGATLRAPWVFGMCALPYFVAAVFREELGLYYGGPSYGRVLLRGFARFVVGAERASALATFLRPAVRLSAMAIVAGLLCTAPPTAKWRDALDIYTPQAFVALRPAESDVSSARTVGTLDDATLEELCGTSVLPALPARAERLRSALQRRWRSAGGNRAGCPSSTRQPFLAGRAVVVPLEGGSAGYTLLIAPTVDGRRAALVSRIGADLVGGFIRDRSLEAVTELDATNAREMQGFVGSNRCALSVYVYGVGLFDVSPQSTRVLLLATTTLGAALRDVHDLDRKTRRYRLWTSRGGVSLDVTDDGRVARIVAGPGAVVDTAAASGHCTATEMLALTERSRLLR